MKKEEKLALFLGMLSGDGCLPLSHSGEGYRDYKVCFCNTQKDLVLLFSDLLFEVFGVHSKIAIRKRKNRKPLYELWKYSKEVVNKLKKIGFPEGVKRDILRIPNLIKKGNKKQKLSFILGVLITDGCLRKQGSILFHSGSKLFLEELAILIGEFTGNIKNVKEYTQREKYKSYQLSLNKPETQKLLLDMPLCDNGTRPVLRTGFRKDIQVRFLAAA